MIVIDEIVELNGMVFALIFDKLLLATSEALPQLNFSCGIIKPPRSHDFSYVMWEFMPKALGAPAKHMTCVPTL